MPGPRMPGRNFLFVPGPTNVPDRVMRAMMVAMEDHRSPKFPELTLSLFQGLKKIFKTENGQVFIFPSSGTGAWEAALSNTLSPGDKVLAPRFGQFSHLWIDLSQRIGLDVVIQDEEWGVGASPDRIEDALRADPTHAIKGVLIVHNETATGVTSDIAAVRRAIDAAAHPAMLYVDGVSSIASIDFRMEEWGVDLAVTGSQKGLMLPAGLGIVCASPRALAAQKTARCTRVFFDFGDHIKAPLYAVAANALWAARIPQHVVRGAPPPRVRTASGFGRGRAGSGKRVGFAALRQGTEMVLQHGERHHGATRYRRRGCDRLRIPSLQLGARRRTLQGCW